MRLLINSFSNLMYQPANETTGYEQHPPKRGPVGDDIFQLIAEQVGRSSIGLPSKN
jgi:hypothetical protein